MVELERFNGRRAAVLENAALRVTVLEGGGHIASILDKASGVSPLWIPPWPSIEPSAYDPDVHGSYGSGVEARLLAGIMGHNLCLDIFGGPSEEEVAAGQIGARRSLGRDLRVRGLEDGSDDARGLSDRTAPVRAADRARRSDRFACAKSSRTSAASDRPIGWTQHVTLGPPFLERAARSSARPRRDRCVFEGPFGAGDYLAARRRVRLAACAASRRRHGQHASATWMPPPPAPTPRT